MNEHVALIATMAAILEAGDRANSDRIGNTDTAAAYAKRAAALYAAAAAESR